MKRRNKYAYPSKTTLNLMVRERSAHYFPKLICSLLVLALVVAAFAKFAVIDRLAAVNQAWNEVHALEDQLKSLQSANENYLTVRGEYDKYFAGQPDGVAAVDAMEVLAIIESKLMRSSQISSVRLESNTLAVVLKGTTLDKASGILQSLYESKLVDTVELYAANTAENEAASISMTIGFVTEGGDAS